MKKQRELVSVMYEYEPFTFLSADAYVIYYVDTRYGADADGNRGWQEIIIDDICNLSAYDEDNNEMKITDEKLKQAILDKIAQKFLEG